MDVVKLYEPKIIPRMAAIQVSRENIEGIIELLGLDSVNLDIDKTVGNRRLYTFSRWNKVDRSTDKIIIEEGEYLYWTAPDPITSEFWKRVSQQEFEDRYHELDKDKI